MVMKLKLTVLIGLISIAISASATVYAQPQPTPVNNDPVVQSNEDAVAVPQDNVQSIADNVCKGVLSAETGNFVQGATLDSCQETTEGNFGFVAKRIINLFSIVVGVVSVIMIIVGGFRYIISGGDSSSVQGAKNTILYAIVGLVIVLFAQVIIRFVLTNVAPVAG